ncbi:MAG: AAA family ATPase [Clostridia bacterium]
MTNATQMLSLIIDNIEKVIVGKRRSIELMVISLMCGGHILIEDVPGVGKTTMVSSLAKSLNLEFKRVQFTSDILPSDIIGLTIYDSKSTKFHFHPGAVMTNILLADEINRTSPKTQSSLLEAMEERQITVDGNTYKLPSPFIVLATQNPIEYIGTFPLPEAQLDRFFMKIKIGYPAYQEEMKILERFRGSNPLYQLESVAEAKDIVLLQQLVEQVHAHQSIHQYVVNIIRATRNHGDIELGVSPRGSLALLHASKAWAIYQGRDYVIPDDVKLMVVPVLSHRIIMKPEAGLKNSDAVTVLESILKAINVPIGD